MSTNWVTVRTKQLKMWAKLGTLNWTPYLLKNIKQKVVIRDFKPI